MMESTEGLSREKMKHGKSEPGIRQQGREDR
jgi:hypothetical protein